MPISGGIIGGGTGGGGGGAVDSVNGITGNVVLTKVEIGLPNVDNTSDANKPVSSAQQAALNLKLDAADVNDAIDSRIATTSIDALSDVDTQSVAPTTGQALVWDGTTWAPATVSGGSGAAVKVEFREVSAGEIAAKQLVLTDVPADVTAILVDPVGGTAQRATFDYQVSGQTINWSGLGLEDHLVAGDVLRITYTI